MIEISSEIIKSIKKVIGPFQENENINLHEPDLIDTNANSYLKNCVDTNWVSSAGEWVKEFEKYLSAYTGAKYVIAVSNGTVALRLALHGMGVKAEEEVLIPPLSFVATANAVSHLGATPHFIDIESETLGMCPQALERRLKEIAIKKGKFLFNKLTDKRISAVIPVHVYGLPAKMIEIKKICSEWGIPLVEDAAEALGSWIVDNDNSFKHCGCFGDVGTISFNGNKIITTGGGGALLTNNERIATHCRHISTTAKIKHPWDFYHDQIGWNDRMPNLNAALGVAQMEILETIVEKKRRLYKCYKKNFQDVEIAEIIGESKNSKSNYWLVTLRLKGNLDDNLKSNILQQAHDLKILLRPSWRLLSELPMYSNSPFGDLSESFNQSKRLINLPSSPKLIK